MNFLFYPGGSYIGGMEVVVHGLMAQLNKAGHRTLAIVSGWNNGDYPTRLRAAGLPFEEVKLGRFHRSKPLWTLDTLRNLPGATRTLRRLAREFRPDAAIYPDPQLLLLGSLIIPRLQNVLYEHNDVSRVRLSPAHKLINARLHRVVCVSDFVAAGVRQAGIGPGRIAVVHNGIVLPSTVPAPTPNQPVRLGIIGQVIPRKQHLTLIRALGILRSRQPSIACRLKIIGTGEGPYAEEVKELTRQLNLQDIVEWPGFFASRDDIYRDLDVVVAPAINEPFGTTILEAGAYGLPVVAARSGGFPEMVVDGTTGLLFDTTELDSLVGALERVIADPSLRDRLGRAGRAHIGQVFTIERMASRFAEVLSGTTAH